MVVAALFLFVASAAHAIPIGSDLRQPVNVFWGCELAPILDPVTGAPRLASTGQTTCTIRNVGNPNNILQLASYVPSNGIINRVRVRNGPTPTPFRLTILQSSPGLCCTAKSFSRVLRPRANQVNQISTFNVNMRVIRSAHATPTGGGVAQVTDAVAYTAVGPGILPLRDQGTAGTFNFNSTYSQLWFPFTAVGDPRNLDAYTIDGIELLMQVNFVRNPNRRDQILRPDNNKR